MRILWTNHAAERQSQWERKLGITRDEVEQVVSNPEQIVRGDQDARVAQTRRHNGLLRVPYVEREGTRRILTVYWTTRVDRYWEGETGSENTIRP